MLVEWTKRILVGRSVKVERPPQIIFGAVGGEELVFGGCTSRNIEEHPPNAIGIDKGTILDFRGFGAVFIDEGVGVFEQLLEGVFGRRVHVDAVVEFSFVDGHTLHRNIADVDGGVVCRIVDVYPVGVLLIDVKKERTISLYDRMLRHLKRIRQILFGTTLPIR